MSRPPAPLELSKASAHTRLLKVAAGDWPDVITGAKREMRLLGATLRPEHTFCPMPVVAWTKRGTAMQTRLLVLEECRTEVLCSISRESLALEGFETLDDFRAYWRKRWGSYRPLDTVVVYRIRPFVPDDREALAEHVFTLLWGDYAP